MEPALFVHILGAMVLVGSLVLAAAALATGAGGSEPALRLGFRAILIGAIPGWIAMRAAAEWVASEQGLSSGEVPGWVDIGYMIADPGALLLIGAAVASRVALGRAGSGRASRLAVVLVAVSLVAYLVVIWAMTAKPV
ncbi:MAG: hypothetical protein H0W09_05640 [Solirubrobacterales bacterium]|nr:hypothetical protein [Solirubrobacterales bacterium]